MFFAMLIQFAILGTSLALPPSSSKGFRQDYEYNRVTDAFYKLHIETVGPWTANKKCSSEGTTLMVTSNEEDIRQLHKMMKQFPDIDYVLVGYDGLVHESAEETPIIDLNPTSSSEEERTNHGDCEVVNRAGEIQKTGCYFRHRPFVCKVEAKDVSYDEQCDMYNSDYKYYDNIKSCYKLFNAFEVSWDEAYASCRGQGAHLLVLNSKAESDTIKEYLTTISHGTYISAGIRENKSIHGPQRVFKTIFNETMEAAGFSEWSPGEPNNWRNSEGCGSITADGKYNDVPCSFPLDYLCEKEVTPK